MWLYTQEDEWGASQLVNGEGGGETRREMKRRQRMGGIGRKDQADGCLNDRQLLGGIYQ